MDGRGGCCIARYAGTGTGAGSVYDASKMSQILQKFRPIAPRPVTGGSVSGGSTSPVKVVKSGKGKRKCAGESTSSGSGSSGGSCGNNSKRCNKKKRISPEPARTFVTLPLLPETPERKDMTVRKSFCNDLDLTRIATQNYAPIWSNNINDNLVNSNPTVVVPHAVKIVGSSVTVECITDTCFDRNDLGCTDEEKVMNLKNDSCPGFISDGENKVTWTNESYRSFVGGTAENEKMAVWLVTKENSALTVEKYDAFTCRVKMQYTCKKERCSITLPCDVWAMDCGGFAWRLDVKAALCLGR